MNVRIPNDYFHGRIEVVQDAMSDSYREYSNKYQQIKSYQKQQLKSANDILSRENTLKEYANQLISKKQDLNDAIAKYNSQYQTKIQSISTETDSLIQKFDTLTKTLKIHAENIIKIQNKNVELKNNVEELEQQMTKMNEKSEKLVIQTHSLLYEQNSNVVEIAKVKVNEIQNNIQDLNNKTISKNEKIQQVMNELDNVKIIKSQFISKQKELQTSLNKLQEVRVDNADKIRGELQKLNSKKIIEAVHKLENERTQLETSLTSKMQQEFNLSKTLNNLEIDKLKKSYKLTEQQHDLDNIQLKKTEYNHKSDYTQLSFKQEDSKMQRLKKLNEQAQELQNSINDINRQLTEEQIKKEKSTKDLEIANKNYQIALDLYAKIESKYNEYNDIENQFQPLENINQEINVNYQIPDDLIQELNNISSNNSKLMLEITEMENKHKTLENQHANLVRQIKQALKIPPDLIQTLKSSHARFLNSKDIKIKVKKRIQARNEQLELLISNVNRLEINYMNKTRKLQHNQTQFLKEQYIKLKMSLFNYIMTVLLGNLTLEGFPDEIDFMCYIFKKLL